MKTSALTIRLDPDLEKQLDRVARKSGRSRSDIARDALRRQLAVLQFEQVRRQIMPFAEARGFLTDEDVAAMRAALAVEGIEEEDRFHLHFALGKALEDRREAPESFAAYAEGNRLRRALLDYRPQVISDLVDRSIATFTRRSFRCGIERSCHTTSSARSGSR